MAIVSLIVLGILSILIFGTMVVMAIIDSIQLHKTLNQTK